ncbi:unnamed protein product [Linum tenue]|uniref:Uncharacterized protein n=1 Tax=Linum tenue TaxID=586396 RepID=A0AAV0JUR4_9ROSI|nr:unnamed protein product [Linum tenue]
MSQVVLLCLLAVVSLSMHACDARYRLSLIDTTDQAESSPNSNYPPKEGVSLQNGAINTAVKHNNPFTPILNKEITAAGPLIAHPRDGLQQQQEDPNNNDLLVGMRKRMGRVLMVEKEDSNNSNNSNGGDDQSKEANYTDDDAEAADQESSGVVVMDYAQPHRKPPIHNEKS